MGRRSREKDGTKRNGRCRCREEEREGGEARRRRSKEDEEQGGGAERRGEERPREAKMDMLHMQTQRADTAIMLTQRRKCTRSE